MFSGRHRTFGDDCFRAAFPAESVRGLAEAVAALERAYPSAVVAVLVGALSPNRWRSSRSAVGSLRDQGRAALRAAPAAAGWVKLCLDHGLTAGQEYGINDALYRLGQLRADLDATDPVASAALEKVRLFLDEVFQPYLLTLLVSPVRYWQRGIIGYLGALNGDLEMVAAALDGFAVALREHNWGSGTEADWDEYTYSETLSLIGRLGPHLDRLRVERDWLAWSAAEPSEEHTEPAEEHAEPAEEYAEPSEEHAEPSGEQAPSQPEQSVAWAQRELAAPSVARRLTACRLLRRLGPEAQPAVPALRAMLAQLDGVAPAAVAELREEAAMALRACEAVPEPATEEDDADTPQIDEISAEAGSRLLALASEDTDSTVRTTALYAIADAGAPIAGTLAVALRAAAADNPQERAAAARLLARLVR